MQGNLITNAELEQLVRGHVIDIKPFERERAQLAHYPLDPESFLVLRDGHWTVIHSFAENPELFIFQPGQYVIVEVRQHIAPGEGIVGLFVPSSNLIEKGLSLTAGKISFPFGKRNERIRFGLRNNLSSTCAVGAGDLVAYVQFFDLSTAPRIPYALSDRDMKIYEARRRIAADDGVWALQNSDPDAPV